MKKNIKLILVLLFLVIFGFSWSFRSEASNAAALETNILNFESPRTLYINNCARCHGADGKSQTALGRQNDAPDISGGKVRRWSSSKLTRLITNGSDSMPAFGKKLTKAQISSLASFVRGL
ncbi:MAG: cytochrome c [Actinomycetota bacterium]